MKKLFQALSAGLVLLILCGFVYPVLVLAIGQAAFPRQANGSMIKLDNQVIGSELIGQDFHDDRFFHGRVSAVHYNVVDTDIQPDLLVPASGSDNYAVSNPKLQSRIQTDVQALLNSNSSVSLKDLPADLFTSSFSGLDPDISPASAEIQVDRIVKMTGIDREKIEQIVKENTAGRDFGIFGEARVNVLKANLSIYKLLNNI